MVLGSMLTSINSLNMGADTLDDSDFYFTEHKILFQVLKSAYKQDKPIDVHLASEELKRQDKLETVGGIGFVTGLAQYAGTSAHIEQYIELVQSKSILRRMIYAAQEVEKTALSEPQDVHASLDEAQQKFFVISQAANPGAGLLISDLLSGAKANSQQPYLKELQDRQELFQKHGGKEGLITGLPTHFADLDKIINGLGNANLIIVAARPAMGKCVVGETPILDPETGALIPIQELVQKRSGKIATLDTDWKLKKDSPSAFVADGIKPTFKITTALGKELEATAVHPLLTIKGWRELKDLKAGDRIATPRKLPYFGKKQWPQHKLKALAYFIADGNLTKPQPGFTNNNPRIVEDFKEACHAFGNVRIRKDKGHPTPSYYISLDRSFSQVVKEQFSNAIISLSRVQKQTIFHLLKRFNLSPLNIYAWANATAMPSYNVAVALEEEFPDLPSFVEVVRNNPVTAFIKELGLMGKGSHDKFFPSEIFELDKDNLAIFISRLFSCDGTAYVANCGGRPFPVIAYSSVSKKLIYQLQHLLLRFGILSKIRRKKTNLQGKIFPSFELEIHGKEDLICFCQQIGIYGKETAVEAVLKQTQSTPIGWTKDTLPIEIWDRILEKKGKRSWGELFRAKNLPGPSNLHARKRSIRRDTLLRLAHVLDDQELRNIASSDVYWDTIVSIEPTGQKEVFDLTVNETHNFIAGDIIVHNTAFATNIAENVCFRANIPVGIFSLEMSAEQLLHRLICSQAEVESDKIKTGSLSGFEYQRIVAAVNNMQKYTMVIDDQPGLKITDLRARARRMKETFGIGLLVVDYLQLISGSGYSRTAENRQNEISEISRLLKTLAREIDIPVICLSQLSRKVEERAGHRPMMSDFENQDVSQAIP